MPDHAIPHETDLLAVPRADGLGKLGQGDRERGHGHRRKQQSHCPPRGWMHEGIEIAPLIPMLHQGSWALPPRAPDAKHNGLEPDAVLVGGPQLHLLLRVGPLQGLDYGRKVFWKAAWAVGSALTWRGRGTLAGQE